MTGALLPEDLISPLQRQRVIARYGNDGAAWLSELPRRMSRAAERWQLELIAPIVPGGHSSCLFSAHRQDGTSAVLKMLFEPVDAERESAILRYWHAQGVKRIPLLYDANAAAGELLLEHLSPAAPLSTLADSPALEAALAELLLDLHRPAAPGFVSVEQWFRRWVSGGDYRALLATGLLRRTEVETVLTLGEELLVSCPLDVTVHGDIHHDNVLSTEQGLIAIDPYGYLGEAAYDVAVWAGKRGDEARIGERARRLGDLLGVELTRVDGWTRVLALDSAKMYAQIAADEPERVEHLVAYLRSSAA